MRICTFALLGIWNCWSQQPGGAISKPVPTANRTVAVCVSQGPGVFGLQNAEALASVMFAKIGVRLDWPNHYDTCRHQPGVIIVTLSHDTPGNLLPDAWAYAFPFEGIHAVVFFDRLTRRWGPLVTARPIMAHVLVHEIAHVLEGVQQHSEAGIMKAQWNSTDYRRMNHAPLAFTEMDAQLIRLGLDERQSRLPDGHATSPANWNRRPALILGRDTVGPGTKAGAAGRK